MTFAFFCFVNTLLICIMERYRNLCHDRWSNLFWSFNMLLIFWWLRYHSEMHKRTCLKVSIMQLTILILKFFAFSISARLCLLFSFRITDWYFFNVTCSSFIKSFCLKLFSVVYTKFTQILAVNFSYGLFLMLFRMTNFSSDTFPQRDYRLADFSSDPFVLKNGINRYRPEGIKFF